MPVFASRSPRRDAARRAFPVFGALRFWAFPAILLCGWIGAGAFSLTALEAATARWRASGAPRPSFEEQMEVKALAWPARHIRRVPAAAIQVPGCRESARFRRKVAQPSYHPG